MTTQAPTAPASEAKCICDPLSWAEGVPNGICGKPNDVHNCGICDTCEHDIACHTPNRADPGP